MPPFCSAWIDIYSWIPRPSRLDGLELAETLLPPFDTVYNQHLYIFNLLHVDLSIKHHVP